MLSHIDLDTLTETLEFEPNEDLLFSFNLYEDGGINNIEHIGLYLNNYGHGLKVADYDTSIIFDRYSPEQLVLTDPNGLIESFDFKIREIDTYNFKILYSFTFTQPLDVTNFYVTVWDLGKHVAYKTFEDVLKINVPGDLHNVSISEEEIIIESDEAKIINLDLDLPPTVSAEDHSNGIAEDHSNGIAEDHSNGIFEGILEPDSEEPKFDMAPEKKVESKDSNTNTLSILIGIFVLEVLLGILIGIIFREKMRKKHLEIPKYPLKLDK